MYYDPYDNTQLKAFRRDPTGRWNTIVEEEDTASTLLMSVLGGISLGALLAIIFAMFI